MKEIIAGIFVVLVVAVLLSLLEVIPVMLLWNWLMPLIFGLPILSFWQTFGLCVLSSCLFKNIVVDKD